MTRLILSSNTISMMAEITLVVETILGLFQSKLATIRSFFLSMVAPQTTNLITNLTNLWRINKINKQL